MKKGKDKSNKKIGKSKGEDKSNQKRESRRAEIERMMMILIMKPDF